MTLDDRLQAEIMKLAAEQTERAKEALVTMAIQANHHECSRLAGVAQTLSTILPDILAQALENINKR